MVLLSTLSACLCMLSQTCDAVGSGCHMDMELAICSDLCNVLKLEQMFAKTPLLDMALHLARNVIHE